MEIRVPCTHCGKVLLVKESSAARVGICPNCHNKVVIARPGTHDTPPKAADTPPAAGILHKTKTSPPQHAIPQTGSSSGAKDTKSTARSDSVSGSSGNTVGNSSEGDDDAPLPIPPKPGGMSSSAVDPLAEVPDAVWYVRPPGGGQFGPASNQVMRTWIAEGRVGIQSMVWRVGWADWLPADRVFDAMLDSPPINPGSRGHSGSRAATYLERKNRRRSMVPTIWILVGLGLIALAAFFIIRMF